MLTPKTLPVENVLLHTSVRTAEELFALVATQVGGADAVLSSRIRERLKRRHLWRSVDLGNGFALPHAAVHGLTTLRAIYLRPAQAIPLSEPPATAVSDCLTLLIPSPGLAAEHDLLMALTHSLLSPAIAQALRRAESATEVQQLLAAGPPRWSVYAGPGDSGSAPGSMP